MPRVHSVVARAAKRPRSCARCGKEIEVGQAVYRWRRKLSRGGITFFQHQTCGRPRPSQLYSRKTAQIEDAIQDADFSFSEELSPASMPGESHEIDTAHVMGILEEIADVAEEVGGEYEEGADAMPEALLYGSQAEAMRDVAQRLQEWAAELRNMDFDTTVELRELIEGEALDDWRVNAQIVLDEAIQRIADEAQEATNDMPEYEG